jgi:hypothetical protein
MAPSKGKGKAQPDVQLGHLACTLKNLAIEFEWPTKHDNHSPWEPFVKTVPQVHCGHRAGQTSRHDASDIRVHD